MRPPKSAAVFRYGIAGYEGYLARAGGFSFFVNFLTLSIPLYSIQVYDRVLTGGSGATLFVLTVAVLGALLAACALEDIRARLLIALGRYFDRRLATRLLENIVENPHSKASGSQLVRDLDDLRHALTGNGAIALFDLPWTPLFIAVCFWLHPLIGVITLVGAVLVAVLAVVNQGLVAGPVTSSRDHLEASYELTQSIMRNAESVRAMGMLPSLLQRWSILRAAGIDRQAAASARNATIASAIKLLRYVLQIGIMAAGAWLVLTRDMSPGALFAATLLCTRALLPVDQIVGVWRQLCGAWSAMQRLEPALAGASRIQPMRLPAPEGRLVVENLSFIPNGARAPALNNVSFEVRPGEAIGIVGPSGAGKSTLARLIVGAERPSSGTVRLDGAETWSWNRQDAAAALGYLSQNIELFEGRISDNIARFKTTPSADVVAAARLAGVHEIILALPDGYETVLTASGAPLSGGQRQRIALARAVFGDPKLVVLDEPNSSLDADGETALLGLLSTLKTRGTTVLVIAHRPSMLVALDKVLVLTGGCIGEYDAIERVMPRIAPGFPLRSRRIA